MYLLQSCLQQDVTGYLNYGTHMLTVQLFHIMFAICCCVLLEIMHWSGPYMCLLGFAACCSFRALFLWTEAIHLSHEHNFNIALASQLLAEY